jgi:hypothetical protein
MNEKLLSESEFKELLREYSTEELEQELKRRQEESNIPQPLPIGDCDWQRVYDMAIVYPRELFDAEHNNKRYPKDFDHYVFEQVIKAVFPEGIWEWINPYIR